MEPCKKKFTPVSLFELFSIGIGPYSSHTVGPMRASYQFAFFLKENGYLEGVFRICVELFGSLAMTGIGHATDIAILLGLEGEKPELIDPDCVASRVETIKKKRVLDLLQERKITFSF